MNNYPLLMTIEKPHIEIYKNTAIFGVGENGIEYSWDEIAELVKSDYENYMAYHDKRN